MFLTKEAMRMQVLGLMIGTWFSLEYLLSILLRSLWVAFVLLTNTLN